MEAIVKGKGDYLLDAKDNQPTLEREISEYVQENTLWINMDCERKTVTGLKPEPHIPHAMLRGYMEKKTGKI